MSGPAPSQRSKRHHYLPQSYLSGWADERAVRSPSVAATLRSEPFRAGIRKVAVEAGLYDRPGADGQPDDALERTSAEFETPLPQLLSLLGQRGALRLTDWERRHLALLIALQLVRTPEQRDVMMFPEDAAEYSGERPVNPEGMRRFLRDEYLGTEPSMSEHQGALDFANGVLAKGRMPRHETFELLIEIAIEQLALRSPRWHGQSSTALARGPSPATGRSPPGAGGMMIAPGWAGAARTRSGSRSTVAICWSCVLGSPSIGSSSSNRSERRL